MAEIPYGTALIVGAGSGISASAARAFAGAGLRVALAARNAQKLDTLASEIAGHAFSADATDPAAVARLFDDAEAALGCIDVVLYNASLRAPGPLAELDPAAVRRSLEVSAFGAFLCAREAARRMVPRGSGAILFTGASASIKGYPAIGRRSRWASFALRGLAQSMAREFVAARAFTSRISSSMAAFAAPCEPNPADKPDSMLDPGRHCVELPGTCSATAALAPGRWELEAAGRGWRSSEKGSLLPFHGRRISRSLRCRTRIGTGGWE